MINPIKSLRDLNFSGKLIAILMGLGMACPIQSSYFLFFVDSQKLPPHMVYYPLVGGPLWVLSWMILLFSYPTIIEIQRHFEHVQPSSEGEKFAAIQFALTILLLIMYAKLFHEQFSITVLILALLMVSIVVGFSFLFIQDPYRIGTKFVGAVIGFGIIQPLLFLLYFLILIGFLYLFSFPPVLLARCINSTPQLRMELTAYGWIGGNPGKLLAALHMFIVWSFLAIRFYSSPSCQFYGPKIIYDFVKQFVTR